MRRPDCLMEEIFVVAGDSPYAIRRCQPAQRRNVLSSMRQTSIDHIARDHNQIGFERHCPFNHCGGPGRVKQPGYMQVGQLQQLIAIEFSGQVGQCKGHLFDWRHAYRLLNPKGSQPHRQHNGQITNTGNQLQRMTQQ